MPTSPGAARPAWIAAAPASVDTVAPAIVPAYSSPAPTSASERVHHPSRTTPPTPPRLRTPRRSQRSGRLSATRRDRARRTSLYVGLGAALALALFAGPSVSPALADTAPTVTIDPATSVTATSAHITGTVNPNGGPSTTTWAFQYSKEPLAEPWITAFGGEFPEGGAEATATFPQTVEGTVEGLQPNATYHLRLTASNAGGEASPEPEVTAGTPALRPTIDTQSAVSKSTSATFEAQINPNNEPTGFSVEYATNKALTGATTLKGSAAIEGFPDQAASVSTAVPLEAGAIYYYRFTAENAQSETEGKAVLGPVQSFATPPVPITDAVTNLTATSATFNGHLTLSPIDTQFSFDYKLGSECAGESATATADAGSGLAEVTEAAEAQGLQPGREYTVCLVTTNASGSEHGSGVSFTTPAAPPAVLSETASAVTSADASLEAKINPENQETGYRFEWAGEEAQLGTPAATTVAGAPPAASLPAVFEEQQAGPVDIGGGLTPGATYFFRVLAENTAHETTAGPVQSFTTLPVAPAATTGAAQEPTATTVWFSGTVNPGGAPTSYHYAYVEAARYEPGCAECAQEPADAYAHGYTTAGYTLAAAADGSQPVGPLRVGELKPGTTYDYAVVASNRVGTAVGANQTFTTEPAPPGPAPAPLPGTEPVLSPQPVLSAPFGDLQSLTPLPGPTEKSQTPASTPTRRQKLAKALKACRRKSPAKRRACERQARKRYGPAKNAGARKATTDRRAR